MTKAEWGVKRICSECGTRYYDMRKNPPTCPKCGTVFEAISAKAKRKPSPPEPVAKAKKPAKPADDLELEDKVLADGGDDEDEEMIEDASELGEDDEDVSEVIETKVEGEGDVERER